MKIYIPIGLPGSGKSTWAAKLASLNSRIVIINRDTLYAMVHGKYRYDAAKSKMVQAWIDRMIVDAISAGFDVVMDECNHTIGRRAKYHSLYIGELVYVLFDRMSVSDLVKRRMSDPRGSDESRWSEVIEKMDVEFNEPSPSEGIFFSYTPDDILAEFKEAT